MARRRALPYRRLPGCALAIAIALLGAACSPSPTADVAAGPLLPAMAARQQQVEGLQLRGAGNKVLVSLARDRGEWRVGERAGWPADSARIASTLAQLAQARRVEPKTASPSMYFRLGVEDIADPEAKGSELRIIGPGIEQRLLVGELHARSGGRYVRANGQARAWLTDVDVGFDPDPKSWLQRRLLEIPLARVERVRIRPRNSPAFALVHRDDRFRPDDAPAGAMGDSHAGDDIAASVQAFDIEDVALDDGSAAPAQSLDFELVDGTVLTVSIWRGEGQQDWARLSAAFDEARASAWATQARRPNAVDEARAIAQGWSKRFAGRRFLLPESLARILMLDHTQILEGLPPGPPP